MGKWFIFYKGQLRKCQLFQENNWLWMPL